MYKRARILEAWVFDYAGMGGLNAMSRRRIAGVSIVPKSGGWFRERYVVVEPGKIMVEREPYTLPVEPPLFDEMLVEMPRSNPSVDAVGGKAEGRRTGKYIAVSGLRWRTGLEDWEKPLLAAAMYFVDPRPEEEVFGDMVELVGREMAEGIAALVWRIALGEGYNLDAWADLREGLKILSPWECIWRFQELVEKGLRRRHEAEPASLDAREVLRAACKLLGTG